MSALVPTHVDVEVLVDGTILPRLYHDGKVWLEAPRGRKWELRLRNRTWNRVLVVPTVDGLSVMDGKEGSWKSNGYILEPYGVTDIPGFRLDDSEVARFKFGAKGSSYAVRVGKPINVGVIGVAVFEEKYTPPPPPVVMQVDHHYYPPVYSPSPLRGWGDEPPYTVVNCCHCSPVEQKTGGGTCSSSRSAPVQNVGTVFGEAASHAVTRTTFKRATSSPIEVVELFYDDRSGLYAKGVLPALPLPQAFREGRGCAPPAGWRRS